MPASRKLVRVSALGLTLFLVGCPLPRALRNQITAAVPAGTIGTAYSATVPVSGYGWTLTAITPPTNNWMTVDASTGLISGTPNGNDFGTWPVTLTYSKGSDTKSFAVDLVVADPTLSFTPATGFVVPFGDFDYVSIAFAPSPAHYQYTYRHDTKARGHYMLSGVEYSTTGAGEQLSLTWLNGDDFQGKAVILLESRAPGRRVIELGPIPSRSGP